MNTNTTTDTTTTDTAANANASKKARTPRAKKAAAVTAPELLPTPEVTKPATHTATAAAQIAAAFFILVTLPPVEKFEAGKGYWQIEIKDEAGRRYSDIYRIKDLEKARDLAEKIAKDRKLPIVTQEPPAPRKAQPAAEAEAIPMPDPEAEDSDGLPEAGADYSEEGAPF
jgi:hypothetical protein